MSADCLHEDFAATVAVQRITDDAGRVRNFMAEVNVHCTQCKEPFHFVGLGAGLSFTRPTVNVGATTLQAPIAPGVGPIPSRMRFEMPGVEQ